MHPLRALLSALPRLAAGPGETGGAQRRCYACFRCVHGCPVPGAVVMRSPGRRVLPSWAFALLLLGLVLGVSLAGKALGHWQGQAPEELLRRLLAGP